MTGTRGPFSNHTPTELAALMYDAAGTVRRLQDIGADLGVTKQRASQLLKQAHIVKHSFPMSGRRTRSWVRCPSCNVEHAVKTGRSPDLRPCIQCRYGHLWVKIVCSWCGKSKDIRISELTRRIDQQRSRHLPTEHVLLFCSHTCSSYGVEIGKKYGWGNPLHPIHDRQRTSLTKDK